MAGTSDGEAASAVLPSVDDYVPEEQGGPIARSGFTYQDHIAAELILGMIDDSAIAKVHCETMDDIVIVWETQECSTHVAEFVQVKTTKKNSLWSCARLCGKAADEPGESVFEKSLAKDKVAEKAIFRIVTLQGVQSALQRLTYERGHTARDLTLPEMESLRQEIDSRCPGAASIKGATSGDWLERTLWVEGPPLEYLRERLLLSIITRSAEDGGAALLIDQAETVLLSLLAWVKRAGDAKFVPDKKQKIIARSQLIQWWNDKLTKERSGLKIESGGKLRRKMTSDVAASDMTENALELRRQFSQEKRSPKYMESSDIEALTFRVRSSLMRLRTRRFSGENQEAPSAFHARCVKAAEAAAAEELPQDSFAKAMALGFLYDIVDRCQLEFRGGTE